MVRGSSKSPNDYMEKYDPLRVVIVIIEKLQAVEIEPAVIKKLCWLEIPILNFENK